MSMCIMTLRCFKLLSRKELVLNSRSAVSSSSIIILNLWLEDTGELRGLFNLTSTYVIRLRELNTAGLPDVPECMLWSFDSLPTKMRNNWLIYAHKLLLWIKFFHIQGFFVSERTISISYLKSGNILLRICCIAVGSVDDSKSSWIRLSSDTEIFQAFKHD